MIKEDLLQFIWKFRLLPQFVNGVNGESIEIKHPGYHNHDSGPDFLNARIIINETLWAGHVEVHYKSSEWQQHGHQNDVAYENVVLHVVYTHNNGPEIPTVELKPHLSNKILDRFKRFRESKSWIPCESHIAGIRKVNQEAMISRSLIERLDEKCERLKGYMVQSGNDWRQSLYKNLAYGFGFKKNSIAMASLADIAPYKLVIKLIDNRTVLEALLFGQAGLIEGDSNYAKTLTKEYEYLKKAFNLKPMKKQSWLYMRMRPQSFPVIRIAQFVDFIQKYLEILLLPNLMNYEKLINNLEVLASDFWDTHYTFLQPSQKKKKKLGKESVKHLIINTFIPSLFFYADHKQDDYLKEKCLEILENLDPEKNNILSKWVNIGMPNEHAAHSQGLLHLKKTYCDEKKCLRCEIGTDILLREK